MEEAIIGRLDSIYIKRKKDTPRYLVSKAILKKDLGIVGDLYSRGGDRQVAILSTESKRAIKDMESKGICSERFHENLTIKALDIKSLKIGSRIKIGGSIQEVSELGKKCFPECRLVKNKKYCPLKTDLIFTKVLKGGEINSGDFLVNMQL